MNDRTNGYIMLIVGIFLMIGALIEMLLVFTGKFQPPQVFNLPAISFPLASLMPKLPDALAVMQPTQTANFEVLPAKQMNMMANMSMTFLLMGFVMSFGYKIATLGVMLIRPVIVKPQVKTDPQQPQI